MSVVGLHFFLTDGVSHFPCSSPFFFLSLEALQRLGQGELQLGRGRRPVLSPDGVPVAGRVRLLAVGRARALPGGRVARGGAVVGAERRGQVVQAQRLGELRVQKRKASHLTGKIFF